MTLRKKIIGIAIIVIVAIGVFFFFHRAHQKSNAPAPTPVVVSPVTIQNVPLIATATANLVANQETNVSAEVGGYINKILFKEGDFVKAGTVLIMLDSRKQQNDLTAAKIDAESSALQYQHDEKAFKLGLILQDTLYNTQVANERNKAIVATDETALQDMTLTAPFSGYVGANDISLGDYVTPGQKLVTLTDLNWLKVEYALPSRFAPHVTVGETIHLRSDFLPNQLFEATVTFVSPDVDPTSQTLAIRAVLQNPQRLLKPGQFMTVTQTLNTIPNALLIPENSVFASMNAYYTFVVKNGHAHRVDITIGEHWYGKVHVLSGLKPTDEIITVGQNEIKDGDPVVIVPASRANRS